MKKSSLGFVIGDITIPYYGFFIVVGIIVASLVGVLLIKRYKKDINDFIILAAFTGLGGLIGAKILYLIVNWDTIDVARLSDLTYLNSVMMSGFVFYGGLIAGLLCMLLLQVLFKIKVLEYVNICLPCLPIVHGFGRLGCDVVGCCYGVEYEGLCEKVYRSSLFAPNNVSLFPVQRTEAAAEFLIAIVLLIYVWVSKKHKYSIEIYLLLYAPVRFILEYFRNDSAERGIFFGLSTSQWISIAIVIFAVSRLIYLRAKSRKEVSS